MAQPSVELTVLSVEVEPGNATGDVRLGIAVDSHGFIGSVSSWADRDAMAAFLVGLRTLYETLAGEAQLASISPGEFVIRARCADHAGHVRVDGRIAMRRGREGWSASFDHALEFTVWWDFEGVKTFADDLEGKIAVRVRRQVG